MDRRKERWGSRVRGTDLRGRQEAPCRKEPPEVGVEDGRTSLNGDPRDSEDLMNRTPRKEGKHRGRDPVKEKWKGRVGTPTVTSKTTHGHSLARVVPCEKEPLLPFLPTKDPLICLEPSEAPPDHTGETSFLTKRSPV